MVRTEISSFQAVLLMLASTGLINHVIIIPMILQKIGRDSWISVFLAAAVALLWSPLLVLICKRLRQRSLVVWFRERYGKAVAGALGGLISLYLLAVSAMTLKSMLAWTKTSYMTLTPTIALLILFLILCFSNSFAGIQSIGATGGILVPFVIVFGFFVMLGNEHQKNYHQLLPFLENGWSPVFKGIFYAGAGFAELLNVLLIQHHVKKPVGWKLFLLLVFCFMGLTLGPLTGAVAEFGAFEAAEQRFPAYEEWRLLFIGRYVEHVDFLSIYQWLVGAFLRISLSMYLIPDVLLIQKTRKRLVVLLLSYAAIGAFVLLPLNDMTYLSVMTTYGIPGLTAGLWIFSLVLAVLIFVRRKQREA
ncbi:GerAB/ArcD/ProY family transporter [Tumebacillus flagellatus]|uniref:Uncharacterized protein n=1 Tax=Tumebacillus flagellatus TaxID=1157490 RepID=A0A074LLC1_9BACL|nr:endospore germination permease [Tumebacillus flagellatus]KEO81909.1 hypothetical protein EL26_18925 [Tumebacillus flagellatus]